MVAEVARRARGRLGRGAAGHVLVAMGGHDVGALEGPAFAFGAAADLGLECLGDHLDGPAEVADDVVEGPLDDDEAGLLRRVDAASIGVREVGDESREGPVAEALARALVAPDPRVLHFKYILYMWFTNGSQSRLTLAS